MTLVDSSLFSFVLFRECVMEYSWSYKTSPNNELTCNVFILSPLNLHNPVNPIIKVDEEDEDKELTEKFSNKMNLLRDSKRKKLQSYLKQKQSVHCDLKRVVSNSIETKIPPKLPINSLNSMNINKQITTANNGVTADSFSLIEKKMSNSKNLMMKKNLLIKSKYGTKNRSSLFNSNIVKPPLAQSFGVVDTRMAQVNRQTFPDEYEYALSQKSIKMKSGDKTEENYTSSDSVNQDEEEEYVEAADGAAYKAYDGDNYECEYDYEYEDEEGDEDEEEGDEEPDDYVYNEEEDADEEECCKQNCNCNDIHRKYEEQEYEYEYEYEYEDQKPMANANEKYGYDECNYDVEGGLGENEYDDVNFEDSGDSQLNEVNGAGKRRGELKDSKQVLPDENDEEEKVEEQSYLDLSGSNLNLNQNGAESEFKNILKSASKVQPDTDIAPKMTSSNNNSVSDNKETAHCSNNNSENLTKTNSKLDLAKEIEANSVEMCIKNSADLNDKDDECSKSMDNSITCTSF